MARKTYIDYKNELTELQLKQKSLESRIRRRALELCKANPDIVVFKNYLGSDYNMTAGRYAENIKAEIIGVSTITDLQVIKSIEAELAARHPHKQTEISFTEPDPICNCDGRDSHVYEEDGKRWCPQCGYEVK